MKKLVFSLFTILIVTAINAQQADELFFELSQNENAKTETIDSETMDLLKMKLDEESDEDNIEAQFFRKVNNIQAVLASDCKADYTASIEKKLTETEEGNGFTTLVKISDEGDNVYIIKKDTANEDGTRDLYIFVIDDEETIGIRITGHMSDEDFDEILKDKKLIDSLY
ncbi:hypothetical protein M2132_001669 [Dysgonomonas sp. PH5-45]|uniref:DUF4252 domain-containing protein n=1 Tax=unclassified Dysgonomonas TaxID=2630389 RepID=UPI0024746009|nr:MULTISPECIES: DUF4252 domain-containing protein [unclassified Dysgonomonas]MDH6355328.1 hypothetical protein [Dysgonomonas sp. PH5-45]MDH6388226.1 hypothetical protein [Dysgonomonas sp. PH5-37]